MGVEIRTHVEVERILVENGRARGLLLSNGERHSCDAVVANSDAVETYRRLIEPGVRRAYTDRRLARFEPSSSGFVLLLGTTRRFEQLAHHNIYFSPDYGAEFRALFDDLRPASDPTIYVCASSRTDASQSPAGHENLFVLVNAPATSGRTDWKKEAAACRALILGKLESYGLESLTASVDYEHTITPEDFRVKYGTHRGSIYGISSNKWSSIFLRPPNRARDIGGLYFAGGATHPGGGIPLVLLSGKMAAEMLLKYER